MLDVLDLDAEAVQALDAAREPRRGTVDLGGQTGGLVGGDAAPVAGDPSLHVGLATLRPSQLATVRDHLLGQRAHLRERGVRLLGREGARRHVRMIPAAWARFNGFESAACRRSSCAAPGASVRPSRSSRWSRLAIWGALVLRVRSGSSRSPRRWRSSGTAAGRTTSAGSSTCGPAGTAPGSCASPRTGMRRIPIGHPPSSRCIRHSSQASAACSEATSCSRAWRSRWPPARVPSRSCSGSARSGSARRAAAAPCSISPSSPPRSSSARSTASRSSSLLVLAAFLLAQRGRWPAAGAVAGLALLTRAFGLALLPALVHPGLALARRAVVPSRDSRSRRRSSRLPAPAPAADRRAAGRSSTRRIGGTGG